MKWHLPQFAAVTALATGMVLAQTPQKAPFSHPMFGHEQMMEALNLTPAQKQQADTIFSDSKQKAGPLRTEMRQNREALSAAVKANNTAQIEKLSTRQGELHGKALAIRSEAMAKFYTILTPEQRTKADDMMSRMRQRMEERMRGRGSEPPE